MKNLLVLVIVNIVMILPVYSMKYAQVMQRSGRNHLVENPSVRDYLSETKQILAKDNNIYDPEPADESAPLDRDHVMNEYWKRIEAAQDPAIKDAALKKILSFNFTSDGYRLLRYHIAAAVYAGANPDVEGFYHPVALSEAVGHKDLALCRLLLNKGANPIGDPGEPLLFNVKTKAIAELFLEKNAPCDALVRRASLLHRVMSSMYEAGLVQLYRNKNLSPFLADSLGYTPLALLAIFTDMYSNQRELSKKVEALLSGIDQEGMRALITPSIFDILSSRHSDDNARFMESLLRSYLVPAAAEEKPALEKKEEQAGIETCPICCDEPVNVATECKHKFCNVCLTLWLQSKNTCPLCRSGIVKP